MSDGQIIGAVIGAVVGAFFPPAGAAAAEIIMAAALGATIGFTIGGIVDPPAQQTVYQVGPRLGDLNTQTADWGASIPRLFGTYRMAGNIIWSADLAETKHVEESGEGKGGGGGTKTENTWYSYAGSWAIAFCEGEIAGYSKIWFDSVLVFDGTNYSGGLSAEQHTRYNGSETQSIDWFLQMKNADSPAYRNIAYIVFRDIELENYGNKLPKVTVELAKSGSTATPKILNTTILNGSTLYSSNCTYSYCMYPGYGGLASTRNVGYRINLFSHSSAAIDYSKPHVNSNLGNFIEYRYFTLEDQENFGPPSLPITPGTDYVFNNIRVYYTFEGEFHLIPEDANNSHYRYLTKPTETEDELGSIVIDDIYIHDICPYNGGFLQLNTNNKLYFLDNNFNYVSELDIDWGGYTPIMTEHHQTRTRMISVENGMLYIASCGLKSGGLHAGPFIFYTIDLLNNITTYLGATIYPNPDSPYYNNLSNCSYMSVKNGIVSLFQHNYNSSYCSIDLKYLDTNRVTVASIVEELLLRAGVASDNIDVSEGIDLVHGYVIPRPMETRAALESVTSAYQFDLIEYDFNIKLKKRNPVSVKTIDSFIDFLQIERKQTVELARIIEIAYANRYNNYDVGIQSALRKDSNTENLKAYQYALALSDSEAKQLAEIYLYSEWQESLKFVFSINLEHINLIPTNVITLKYKGSQYNVRLTKVLYATNKQLNCEGHLESEDVYVSNAIGSDTGSADQVVNLTGPTNFELLDIPMLDDSNNKEGIYIATGGYFDSWYGCNVSKSTNNGINYSTVGSNVNSCILGSALTLLPSGPTDIIDTESIVTIALPQGDLYDISYLELINSNNYILIGNEILQYQDATDNGDGTFDLQTFIRGRRGTEWAVGTHSIGERFVLLSNDLIFESSATRNVEAYYKATTFGLFLDDSVAEIITPNINCLKPFSPYYVRAKRESNNDITIKWMRRSRSVAGYFTNLQLLEETEAYEVEIETGLGRTIVASSATATYTASEQTSDNIILGDPVTFTVYQLSGIVGRGYGTQEIV